MTTTHGTNKAHFGTAAGREEAARIAAGLRRNAEDVTATAARVRANDPTTTVYTRQREFGGKYVTVAVATPTASQREAYAARLDHEAKACTSMAAEYDAKVAGWTPMEPVVVPMEERKAPTVHFRATFYSKGGHKACASSAMGAMRGYALLTENPAEVTCERCKLRKGYVEAASK